MVLHEIDFSGWYFQSDTVLCCDSHEESACFMIFPNWYTSEEDRKKRKIRKTKKKRVEIS